MPFALYPHTPVLLCKSAQVIDYLKLSSGEARTKIRTQQGGQNCPRTHYITPVNPKDSDLLASVRGLSLLLFAPRLFQLCWLASGLADLAAARRVFFKVDDEFRYAAFDGGFGLG